MHLGCCCVGREGVPAFVVCGRQVHVSLYFPQNTGEGCALHALVT
jgi:hypothetical protein